MTTKTLRSGSLLGGLVDACSGGSRSGALTVRTEVVPSAGARRAGRSADDGAPRGPEDRSALAGRASLGIGGGR